MIEKMKRENFDYIYAIMEESFPTDERRPYAEQKRLLDSHRYSIYTDEQNTTFIACWEFDDFIFIEHFAVSKEHRNKGLGSLMLSEFLEKQGKTVCLEVELPDTDIAKRRIRFYERNGLYLNEYEYFQPPISKGKEIVPLMVMTSQTQVDEITFGKLRNILYKEVYKYNI